jgi:PAS domain S-box-containing protein
MVVNLNDKAEINQIYSKLYEIGKSFNINNNVETLYDTACDFVIDNLKFEKCIIFEHDDSNGWFKVVKSKGYINPIEVRVLSIINLLLSGEVIEYLRVKGEPIIHEKNNPKKEVESLIKSLFLEEAYFELFGGDDSIPFGLIIVGNGANNEGQYSSVVNDPLWLTALGNFTLQLSNTINNNIFYKAWREEKEKLEENIKKRTKQIEDQKETFEAIYKTSKDGMAILDFETTAFLDVNDAYCEMTGYTKEELLRTSCFKLSIESELEASKNALKEIEKKGFITNYLKTCVVKDGSFIIVNMSISMMSDKKRIFVSAKDITEQKKLEQELQEMNLTLEAKVKEEVEKNRQSEFHLLEQSKNASMGEMIGNIAHQWRQPLSAITSIASSQKLHQEMGLLTPDDLFTSMDSIIHKANYLSETINTFRNFLKVDKDKKEFIIEKTLKQSLQIVEATLKDYYIKLDQDVDYNCNHKVVGIESEISQVVINILNNAKDVLKEKKIDNPKIYMCMKVIENTALITIEDNGGGVPEHVMPRIFEPYFTTKHKSQGTGLGLHMSFRIITESFSGKLYVQNSEIGAKFFIELPIS